MQHIDPWNLAPELRYHVYCNRKNEFFFDEETYSESVVLAVEEGSFQYGLGEVSGTCKAGDLILCPRGMAFRRKTISPLSYHFFRLNWLLPDGKYIESAEGLPKGKISISNTGRLFSTFAQLRQVAGQTNPFSIQWKMHLLKDIWLFYCAEIQQFDAVENADSTNDPIMSRAFVYLKENAYKDINLKDVANFLGFSQVQFTRKFYAAFSMTPVNFLTNLRLNKAKKLLTETGLTLGEVANRCGYDNGYYFSRVFTQKVGMNPSLFRKMHLI